MSSRLPCRIGLILTLLCALPLGALAQEPTLGTPADDGRHAWASVALGAGGWDGMRDDYVFAAALFDIAATMQRGPSIFTLRVSGATGVFSAGVWDVGLLYGRVMRRGLLLFSGAGGLGYITWYDDIFGGEEDRSTIGLPLNAAMVFAPIDFLGIGLEAVANLNTVSSYGGLAVVVRFGDLR